MMYDDARCTLVRFNPRLPGGRRHRVSFNELLFGVSIHAFRGEGDSIRQAGYQAWLRFNPRLPGGRRPVRGSAPLRVLRVSIHAFRGEGDTFPVSRAKVPECFNPRLPGGRRRRNVAALMLCPTPFQSTPSGGKATFGNQRKRGANEFQSTPSGGKATDCTSSQYVPARFQSTPSGGKATVMKSYLLTIFRRFNPRLPGGRRPSYFCSGDVFSRFQSTPSGGKATSPLQRSYCKS